MRATDMLFAIPPSCWRWRSSLPSGRAGSTAPGDRRGLYPDIRPGVCGPVLALRDAGYVRAGRVLGFSPAGLLFRHILPNVAGVVAVQTSLALAWAVLAEATP